MGTSVLERCDPRNHNILQGLLRTNFRIQNMYWANLFLKFKLILEISVTFLDIWCSFPPNKLNFLDNKRNINLQIGLAITFDQLARSVGLNFDLGKG